MNKVRQTFSIQAEACADLGSRFMGELCQSFAENLTEETAVGKLCLTWPGNDPGPSGDSVPLRLCGGLHALVLTGKDERLASFYTPQATSAPPWDVIEAALIEHEPFLLDWMTSPPQTNEVGRSGIVWPAMMAIARWSGLPLRLLEVGASAGLNLQMDRFYYRFGGTTPGNEGSPVRLAPDMRGEDVTLHEAVVADRAGCDIRPLDPLTDADALRLWAFLWPDQADRMTRLDGALALARTNPVIVAEVDAVDWLRTQLAQPVSGQCSVIYSTIAWQYLPHEARATGETVIRAAGARATADAPLAWLRVEADGDSPGAGIHLVLWPSGQDIALGRADFHGRWLDWRGSALVIDN
ncbi:MAG: DUF2332 family protein [Ahrensia sp.]|nr:DUF2332 family protein [Ahrensia sp.]